MKILVCEDDIIMIKAIEHKLKSEGYTIDVATDGIQASEKISNNEYDLIMTDLLMPFFGGLELVNKVRNEMKLNVPIIVLTRVGNEDTIIEAFKLGADDYVTKPFSPNELSIRVKRLLIRR
jgi:DNA-binding response OmpR family regulator